MKLKAVDNVPEWFRRPRYKLEAVFEEFMRMNVKVVKVDLKEGEYKTPKAAYTVLYKAAKRYAVPVKVHKRADDIYFERTDI